MELNWNASFSASCMHAVDAIWNGRPLADRAIEEALTDISTRLRQWVSSRNLSESRIMRHLVPLSATIENNRELAERTLAKAIGKVPTTDIDMLTAEFSAIENAVRTYYPNLTQDLTLRIRPLREQWESRGPGLLRSVARLTDERVLVPNASVVLVHPSTGGGGSAHLVYNSVRIEGLLANPFSQLPETVRLGWLLAQLNADLPVFADTVNGDRLPMVAALAFLPVVLKAAEDVEWAQFDQATLAMAIEAWQIHVPEEVNGPEVVMAWWGTFSETAIRWEIALAALEKMLFASSKG